VDEIPKLKRDRNDSPLESVTILKTTLINPEDVPK
jgi:hypothetical protein